VFAASPFATNALLAALPATSYQKLAPHLERVSFLPGETLLHPGDPLNAVYFPQSGLVVRIVRLDDGSAVEAGAIGREGVLGVPAAWVGSYRNIQVIAPVGTEALKLDAELLRAQFATDSALQQQLIHYMQAQLEWLAQTAACNAKHAIERRLARWLLGIQDSAQSRELMLTQEQLAHILGARRSSVTVVARWLKQQGLIRYQRGRIAILNRMGLEAMACECRHVLQAPGDC